jgi:CO/xanthine dehydrogenase FAD-binding subunit
MTMDDYLRPTDLGEAVRALASGRRRIVAGGTDVFPALGDRPLAEPVLDITGLDSLRGVAETADHWRIGALVTWSELATTRLPPAFDGLRQAAGAVGGPQVQNVATVCGNVCNASPAADGVPNLLALGAEVELASAAGERVLALDAFILGNRRTARRPDEMVTGLRIPRGAAAGRGAFLKLGAREHLVIAIVSVAAVVDAAADGTVRRACLAVGACSEVPRRLAALEAALAGARRRPLSALVAPEHLAPLDPIDDVRGSAAYRREVAATLVRRILDQLGGAP